MDYTKFLNKKEHVILPYLGGPYVFGKDRRLRIDGERPPIGFHRFEVSGRNARALEAVDGLDQLQGLPKARGHLTSGWLAHGGGLARLALLPEDEPPPLTNARARRWHSGDFLFESLDFDAEAEDEARLRLEQGASLEGLKGVHATLRTAYGIALGLLTARRIGAPLSVLELRAHATAVADGGEAIARELVARLERERAEEAERARIRALATGALVNVEDALAGRLWQAQRTGRRGGRGAEAPTLENAAMRAEVALDGAHARMLSTRTLANAQLEVAFEFMNERFISVVDAISLQVYDSGVCLAGEDDLVTLDSLPGVIREAIDTGRLVITRR